MPEGLQLDQLWYTWSSSGLETMNSGYRVRAASEGLREVRSKRNRQLERYFQYSLPMGLDLSTFDTGTAPVSLALIDHKDDHGHERLLIRKVFKGQDTFKRGSVHFVHLIAGLPETFTARQAISLWYCPEIWRDSDEELAPHITTLSKIPYEYLLSHVIKAKKPFPLAMIGQELECLIQQVLAEERLPPHITAIGQSNLIAALIYGLTQALPANLLSGLTFNTYDHNPQQSEELFVGHTTLQDLIGASGLHVQIEPHAAPPIPPAERDYLTTVTQSLLSGNEEQLQKVEKMIRSVEERNPSKEALLSLFQRRFYRFPLPKEQLQDVLTYPAYNTEDMLDPVLQKEWARALLQQAEYRNNGELMLFAKLFSELRLQPSTTQNAALTFTLALAQQLTPQLESIFDDTMTLQQWRQLLDTLVQQSTHQQIYQKFWYEQISLLAQKPVYTPILTGRQPELYTWLLEHIGTLNLHPQSEADQQFVRPWLAVTSWSMLALLLDRYTPLTDRGRVWPTDWLTFALRLPLARPLLEAREALDVIDARQQIFRSWLEAFLSNPGPTQINDIVLQFFQYMFAAAYEKRVEWLVFFLLHITDNPDLVTRLLTIVALHNQYPLSSREFFQILTTYTLDSEQTTKILTSLQNVSGLPRNWSTMVQSWQTLTNWLHQPTFVPQHLEEGTKPIRAILKICRDENTPDIGNQFVSILLAFFTEQIRTESELQLTLDFFEKVLGQNKWEILYWIAEDAGKRYAAQEHISRLRPFLQYAIDYGLGSRRTPKQFNMATYLQHLYGPAGNELRQNMDQAIASGFLGTAIQNHWSTWRNTEKNPQNQSNRQFVASPGEQEYRVIPTHQRGSAGSGQEALAQTALVKLRSYEEYIPLTAYRTLASILGPMAEFWLEHVFRDKYATQLPTFERKMFTKLIQELEATSNDLSSTLCQLLIDNAIIQHITKESKGNNIEEYMQVFPQWIRVKQHQGRTFPEFTLEAQKQGFTLLVRRHLFIRDLESRRKNPQKQLENARMEADVEYFF